MYSSFIHIVPSDIHKLVPIRKSVEVEVEVEVGVRFKLRYIRL